MIDLLPNIEQQQIADTIRRFLADNLPVERYRRNVKPPRRQDRSAWPELAELGCFGLSLAEDHGGAGLSIVEEIMAFREYGRALLSPAVLASVLAAHIAAAAGRNDLVAELVAGTRVAGLLNPVGAASLGKSVNGSFQVIDGIPGDLLVGWNESGAVLVECAATPEDLVCLDQTVKFGRLALTKVSPLAFIAAEKDPIPQMAQVLLAAMLTGMLEAVRDLSADYAKTREQFGRPIGTFQGVKHRCADMALWAEAAWSQTAWAALVLRAAAPDAAFQAANAKMIAADSALDAARRAVQIFGGMGFTAEVNVHLFLKRAHLYEQLGGSSQALQEKLIDLPLEA